MCTDLNDAVQLESEQQMAENVDWGIVRRVEGSEGEGKDEGEGGGRRGEERCEDKRILSSSPD